MLKTYEIENREEQFSTVVIYFGIIVFIFFFALLSNYIFDGRNQQVLDYSLLLFCLVVFISFTILYLSYCIYFSKYLIKNKGSIIIKESSMLIDGNEFPLEKITRISLFSKGPKFLKKGISVNRPINKELSVGIDNYIIIKFEDGENITRAFEIKSNNHNHIILKTLSDLILENNMPKIDSSSIKNIFSEDIRKSDKARNYVAQKIKERKLNVTDGLLMMNYSSDKEAKELRRKYNL